MVQFGIIKNSVLLFIIILCVSCTNKKNTNSINKTSAPINEVSLNPIFNTDSAYFYIEKQVAYGPRVPNSEAHAQCAEYLVETLERFGAQVITQEDIVQRYDGIKMEMKNIIGSFNPDAYKRILLCAHWDTRFIADYDSINTHLPILGANDGGSGVGVLLEIARQINLNPIDIGVDIIFFDVEDQGQPNNQDTFIPHSWCLGSQYWSLNPHVKNYFADYGILLDMVGAQDAVFAKEGVSQQFAPRIVDKVWKIAQKNGFSNFFISQKTPPIIDDHLYINNLIHIPTINIVEYNDTTHNKFNAHHHKHSDNMSIINKETLQAVGQTVLAVVYNEI